MKQSFIKIGEGLTDLFEFTTLIEFNPPYQSHHLLSFATI